MGDPSPPLGCDCSTTTLLSHQDPPSSPPPPSSNVVGDLAYGQGEECRTPTSDDHKIPEARSCPPTPRKRPAPWNSHKRKATELQFFESTGREEVESFFRRYYGQSKKRCTSV
ncbi:hypothetical protein MLD38_008272 [Melastoma candidum]|uniref:Uncharacterized protein n=1 Tax=Melastoma candidum TaxID=119954 RepID=A0ACB9RSX4_9MYRT|nr:hypothetical protein MLD38_008272 [Melastoma candidum]